MGLDIGVGVLAQARREVGDEAFADLNRPYVHLNEILRAHGLPPHHEPLDIKEADVFEAPMWSYSGLHMVRRLAAFWAVLGRLPTTAECEVEASTDPILERQFELSNPRFNRRKRRGVFERLFSGKPETPRFQHLLWHSDCEGFYVPQDFANVLLDEPDSNRESIGGMVGSTQALLRECRELAAAIELPRNIDLDSKELWAAVEDPVEREPTWKAYGVEAMCLTALLRGCALSIRHRAVLAFG
jgi:hypothetical protein